MALPGSDQRGFVCADRECGPSRLSYDPARAPVEKGSLGHRSPIFHSPRHAGEHLAETGSQQELPSTAVVVRASAKVNKSR